MDLLAENPTLDDIPALKELWKIAFDESDMVLDMFFKTLFVPSETLIIRKDEKPVSVLYLLPCSWMEKENSLYTGYYIYSVATHPNYRGNGYADLLLKAAYQFTSSQSLDFLFLVPGSSPLFNFYRKRDYTVTVPAFYSKFSRNDFINHDVLPYSSTIAKDYARCRFQEFSSLPSWISYPDQHFLFSNYLYSQYRRKSITFRDSSSSGFSISEPVSENKIVIKETLLEKIPFPKIQHLYETLYPVAQEFQYFHPNQPGSKQNKKDFALFRYINPKLAKCTLPYVACVLD